jgi:hypothetical protein
MTRISKLFASLAGLLIVVGPSANAALVGFQIGTDSVFKNAAGVAFASTDTAVSARFGYFADSISATTAYTDSQIIALITSPSTGAVSLGSKFVSLGSIDFGKYTNTTSSGVTTSVTVYAESDVEDGKFIRNWELLNTKPESFDTAGVLSPYLFVTSGAEYLVVRAGPSNLIPSNIDTDTSGSWGINGLSSYDPDNDETLPARAFLVGSLGSFDSASNSFSTVPEPATGFLLLSGGLGALLLRRKKV